MIGSDNLRFAVGTSRLTADASFQISAAVDTVRLIGADIAAIELLAIEGHGMANAVPPLSDDQTRICPSRCRIDASVSEGTPHIALSLLATPSIDQPGSSRW
jgi:hypothetical protein